MRVDLTINEVGKTWQFDNEQVWSVTSNGRKYSFYSPYKPVIGSYIPCMVEERPTTDKKTGKPVTFLDARPIPKEMLNDDVPNFPTPGGSAQGSQRLQELYPSKQAEKPPEQPQDTLYRRIPHKSEAGVFMYEPAPQAQDTKPALRGSELASSGAAETPEWAKPGPKPTLTGDLYLMGRYLDVLLNHPKINLANEVNWLGGFASVIATGLRDYHDGKLEVNVDLIPDDIRAAYQAAADGVSAEGWENAPGGPGAPRR